MNTLTVEYQCDVCEKKDGNLYAFGSDYGIPLHSHEECKKDLVELIQAIVDMCDFKKMDFEYDNMFSKESFISKMITPESEILKPEIQEKIKFFQNNVHAFLKKTNDFGPSLLNKYPSIMTALVSWTCLYK